MKFRALARFVLKGLKFTALLLLVAWAALAIYYSNLPWRPGRLCLALVFAAFSVWALFMTQLTWMKIVFTGAFIMVVIWFISIRPSHQRQWRAEVAVLPGAVVDGDEARLTGFREFEYRGKTDFTPRYTERTVSLSHLTSVDLLISYWKEGAVGHTFVSFEFDNASPVCISIEIRPEEGESFAFLPSLFKQYELIYVLGAEDDLIHVRTNHRNEEVYFYPIRVSPEAARRLFLIYCDRINKLAGQPEFYHLLSNNCTINIARYANAAGRQDRFDIRYILNGFIDRYIYGAGLVDTTLAFEDLRRHSRITEVARASAPAEISRRIRTRP